MSKIILNGIESDISISSVKVKDALKILKVYGPYVEGTAVTFEHQIPTEEEYRDRIGKIISKYPFIKIEDEIGQILGFAYAKEYKEGKAFDWSVETSIYVRGDIRRNGLGKMLYEELEKRLIKMGVTNLNACVAVPSEKDPYVTKDSIKFHKTMGFKKVGVFHNNAYKFNQWYDIVWMEKLVGEYMSMQEDIKYFIED